MGQPVHDTIKLCNALILMDGSLKESFFLRKMLLLVKSHKKVKKSVKHTRFRESDMVLKKRWLIYRSLSRCLC